MPACAAYGCTNRPSKQQPGITFHKFPKNADLREAWVKACRRKNWMPSHCSCLCSEHFSEDQIDRTSLSVVRLRENVVPHMFKGFPAYLRRIKTIKRLRTKNSTPFPSARSGKAILPETSFSIPEVKKSINPTKRENEPVTKKAVVDCTPDSIPEAPTVYFKHNGVTYTFYEETTGVCKKAPTTEKAVVLDNSSEDFVAELDESISIAGAANQALVDESKETVSVVESNSSKFVDKSEELVPIVETISNECTAESRGNASVVQAANTFPVPGSSMPYLTCESCASPFNRTSPDESLKRKVDEYEDMVIFYRKKIRTLNQKTRRFKRKIEKMNSLFDDLKQKQLVEADALEMLSRPTGPNQNFLEWKLSKIENECVPEDYAPELQPIALTLHFYSQDTYDYVRDTFQTFLPHCIG